MVRSELHDDGAALVLGQRKGEAALASATLPFFSVRIWQPRFQRVLIPFFSPAFLRC